MEYYKGLTLSAIKLFFLLTMSRNANQPVDENSENHHVEILSSYNSRLLKLLRKEVRNVANRLCIFELKKKEKKSRLGFLTIWAYYIKSKPFTTGNSFFNMSTHGRSYQPINP